MIICRQENAGDYATGENRLLEALQFLRDLAGRSEGRYQAAQGGLSAVVQTLVTHPDGLWEAHRQHIDLHCLLEGHERIGFAPVRGLRPVAPYDREGDAVMLAGTGQSVTLEPGDLAVFYPGDAHQPGLQANGPESVRKVVIKVPYQPRTRDAP